MFLPLRLAAAGPVGVAMTIALIVGLASAEGRRLHPVYGLPNGAYLPFFVGIAALLLVLPNLVAAAVANRYSGGAALPFAAILTAVFAAAFWVQAIVLNRLFKGFGGNLLSLSDWRLVPLLAANLAILLGIAFWASAGRSA